jgi:hypothetical protein
LEEDQTTVGWTNTAICKSYVSLYLTFMDELIKRKLEPALASQTTMDFITAFISINPNQTCSNTITELMFTPDTD